MYNNNNNGNEGNDYATTIRSLIQTVRKLQLSIDVAHEKKLDFDKEENRRVAESDRVADAFIFAEEQIKHVKI